ncbi:MAG: hypothetical protein RR334_03680 [Clostridia bacterium]
MENKKDIKKTEIVDSGIDKDVLEIMASENIIDGMGDQTQINRVILNCFCELLSEVKDMTRSFDDFMSTLTICSADKLSDFFVKLRSNVEDEQKVQRVQNKVKKSHLKSKKKAKESPKNNIECEDNVFKFPKQEI